MRLRLEIRGAVQGVGFRPLVYRVARELGVRGWVINDTRGLTLEAEAARATLERLERRLRDAPPPRAVVHEMHAEWLAPCGYVDFEIRRSDPRGKRTAFILPDIATCADCLAETRAPEDRRAGYPFTNCTACGPRFSIIRALPYDRPNTTMSGFVLCDRCAAEYQDPSDRRYHAQPNACAVCGPRVWLTDAAGTRISEAAAALRDATHTLRRGLILALKGLGGFQLLVDATSCEAIARLRERKHRWEKPLALMVRDLEAAARLCELPPRAAELLTAPEAPIVLLSRRRDAPVAAAVAPDNRRLGLMLPYTPLHHLLLSSFDCPVVATSGNLTDEPICIDNEEALSRLNGIADRFLMHNRPIERHVDDSVVVVLGDDSQIHRRARGYAPLPVTVPTPLDAVLAVGSHQKNTVALGLGHEVFISQHIGDLDTVQARQAHHRVIADLVRLYSATPRTIVHDLHPDYASTQWAVRVEDPNSEAYRLAEGARLVAVGHHHAHLAACLAEHRFTGKALGVTWDGTGLGPDGTIWGGEFLLGDATGYERVAHLMPFRLPGGERAAREPYRSALGVLFEVYGDRLPNRVSPACQALSPSEHDVLQRMLRQGVGSPITTSAGRLFDAVASLLGLRQRTSFEGQAAIELEQLADPSVREGYEIPVQGESRTLDFRPMVERIIKDAAAGVDAARIAGRFHLALADAILAVAREVQVNPVALSGGCFQNRLLTEACAARLRQAGFDVLLHRQVPPNDGCISLGQAVVAGALLAS